MIYRNFPKRRARNVTCLSLLSLLSLILLLVVFGYGMPVVNAQDDPFVFTKTGSTTVANIGSFGQVAGGGAILVAFDDDVGITSAAAAGGGSESTDSGDYNVQMLAA